MKNTKLPDFYISTGLLVLRIGLGIVMMAHGSQKLFGWFGGGGLNATVQGMSGMGIPIFLVYLAVIAEFFGGLGVLTGTLTRVAAFGIFSTMAVATFKVHWANGFFSQNKGYEFAFTLMLMALGLILTGAGRISIDAFLSYIFGVFYTKRKSKQQPKLK